MYFLVRITIISAVLFTAACTQQMSSNLKEPPPESAKGDPNRKEAPAFTLKDSEGRNLSLSDLKGKVVLLNFWATWCGPCKIEIPWFVEFEQKYKDRGFAVVGVSMDEEGWEVVKPYMEKNRVNYRMVIGDEKVAENYGGVESLPTTFVIDKNGRIASTHVGLVSKSVYENEILQLLDGSSRAQLHSSPVERAD